ncbi:uncharacterized protein HD556DRAFT_1302867 [Suillus plorans]|uniref:Flavin reductase like domain-containing protein n=1 Tax=Suillus plorans TaxID=116603 RepID=A0A9P7J7C1_9AGAM|nr:uncharacterized protein HD556DRAFT_1302867 [Suillus plorans]KAG1806377.1 hypothetical protein HD556DRAFT_1302867 [Suillus plorans]
MTRLHDLGYLGQAFCSKVLCSRVRDSSWSSILALGLPQALSHMGYPTSPPFRESTPLILEKPSSQANLQGVTIVIAIDSNIHKVLISGIVQPPIAFVSMMSEESIQNPGIPTPLVSNMLCMLTCLASISLFNTFMNYPPIILFTCNHSTPGRIKDTIANLKNSQGFTVDIISK